MFEKIGPADGATDPAAAESLADLLFEIGRDLLTHEEYRKAVKWLERAHDTLCEQDVEKLSTDAAELRRSIVHQLGQFASPCACRCARLTCHSTRFAWTGRGSCTRQVLGLGQSARSRTYAMSTRPIRMWSRDADNVQDYGNRMIVSLLKLELLSNESPLDAEKYYYGKCRVLEYRHKT